MKKLLLILFFAGIFTGSIQAQLNDYKYIIIPKQFDTFKKKNQYLTSTLVKHLFVQQGFNAVYEEELPDDLNNNRCLGLTADLEDDSSLFSTKTAIVLKDCKSQEIFRTQQGSSKEKDFKAAYNEAIRQAFQSLKGVSYDYTPGETSAAPVSVSFKNDVKELNKTTPEKKEAKANMKKDEVVLHEATPEQQRYKNLEPQPSDMRKADSGPVKNPPESKAVESAEIWYAQEIPNGYQLVDSSPRVRLKLFKSSLPDVYFAENEKGKGLVYQKNGQWYFEYYQTNHLITEALNIKF